MNDEKILDIIKIFENGITHNLFRKDISDKNLMFFKSCFYPSDIILREKIKKHGNSKAFETFERINQNKDSLIAYVKNETQGYNLMLVKGEKKYFIFIEYNNEVYTKSFGLSKSIGMWKLSKENYEFIKNNDKLVIQNKDEWDKFEAFMVAKSLSEDN